jgi:formylglycine-generating enzyme required for sulfatase activity
VPKRARARGQRRLKLVTVVALVILVVFAGVFAWQRWSPHEPAEVARRGGEKPVVVAPAPAPAPTGRKLKALDTFTDCRECPEMVVIPAGSFTMGSPANEPGPSTLLGHRFTVA